MSSPSVTSLADAAVAGVSRGIEPVPTFLVTQEVAAWLRVPIGTLAQWRSYGKGPAWHTHGRRVVYAREDVEAFIAAAREASPARKA